MPDERDRLIEDALRRGTDDRAAVGPLCLDAETAAAWVDGSLGAEQLDAARRHAADCARCQMLLSALLGTQPVSASAVREQTRAVRAIWQRWTVWAAPLATAALLLVAVMVWTRIPGVSAPTSVARDSASPSDSRQERVPPPPPASAPLNAAAPPVAAERGAPAAPVTAPSSPPAPTARADAATRDTLAVAEPLSKSAATTAAAAAPAPVTPPSASADATFAPRSASPAPVLNETIAVAPVVVVSSDPSVRWRIEGASLAKSVDGGSTWTRVDLSAVGTLTAGSAPSSTVCWIAGRGGVVWRTVDGTAWSRVGIPAAVDLTTIVAEDARSATVTAADGRRFDTRDGGAHWILTGASSPR